MYSIHGLFDKQTSTSTKKTFFIAEIGSNHLNDLSLAKESIAAAAQAGADAVKFQSINIDELYYKPSNSVKDLHSKIDLQESWHQELKNYADKMNIVFFSSPTYLNAIEILEGIEVELYKLASIQVAVFPQLVKKVAELNKPTILSTGLVTIGELDQVIELFHQADNRRYIILHCNSIYPTPPELVCLERMQILKEVYDCPVGFSDHTEGNAVALAAIAKGAEIIEKHFTISKKLNGPDAFFSAEPREFEALVKEAQFVRDACSPCFARLELEKAELDFKTTNRYRLVLARPKGKNEPFHEGDFEYKRHDQGIDCRQEQVVISSFCAGDSLKKGTLIEWHMLEGRKL